MIPKKSMQDILQTGLEGIVQETEVTLVSPGSVARAICGGHAKTLAEFYDVLDNDATSRWLALANGFYLDLLGDTFGLTRRVAAPSTVAKEDKVLRFYVRSGNLASRLPHPTNLNLGRLPQSTQVSNGSITYIVDDNYDFPASASEVFVGAVSTGRGASQKVGAGELDTHDLNVDGLLVQNVAPIDTGADQETDTEFRFRISQFVRSSQGANEAAVRLAVLSAPGVADMIRMPYAYGPGSFKITVIPTGNRVPLASLNRIRAALEGTVAYGVFYTVEEPRYIPVSFSARLIPRSNSVSVRPADRDAAEAAVRLMLGNIRPGKTLVMNQLRAAILNSSSNIGDVVIQSFYVNGSARTLTNYTLKDDELLVPDDRVQNPILVL